MAGNDLSWGGGWRYGWQPGMTNDEDWLTVLRYIDPDMAAFCDALLRALARIDEQACG